MIRTLLVTLLIAFPVLAGEDFTQRDTCLGYWGMFTDGDKASALVDHCDGEGAQGGGNTLVFGTAATVDDGDVPAGFPPNSDSLVMDGTAQVAGHATGSEYWNDEDMLYGGWYKNTDENRYAFIARQGNVGNPPGKWAARCWTTNVLRIKYSGTWNKDTDPEGLACGELGWSFWAWQLKGSSTDEIATYGSQSGISKSLYDCGGGSTPCNTNSDQPGQVALFLSFATNAASGGGWIGNFATHFYFEGETFSDAEICQMCRCGGAREIRGVGLTSLCNHCTMRPYQRCRRVID